MFRIKPFLQQNFKRVFYNNLEKSIKRMCLSFKKFKKFFNNNLENSIKRKYLSNKPETNTDFKNNLSTIELEVNKDFRKKLIIGFFYGIGLYSIIFSNKKHEDEDEDENN